MQIFRRPGNFNLGMMICCPMRVISLTNDCVCERCMTQCIIDAFQKEEVCHGCVEIACSLIEQGLSLNYYALNYFFRNDRFMDACLDGGYRLEEDDFNTEDDPSLIFVWKRTTLTQRMTQVSYSGTTLTQRMTQVSYSGTTLTQRMTQVSYSGHRC